MANFTRVKPAGWALNEILTSAQMNALDIDHVSAVNGDGGSSHVGDVTLNSITLTATATVGTTADIGDDVDVGTADTSGETTIRKGPHPGSDGADDGFPLTLRGQDGRQQSGGADNNSGGPIIRRPGKPGAGGGGAAGGMGMDHLRASNDVASLGVLGAYEGVADFAVPGSGGANTTSTAPIFGVSRTALVIVTCVFRTAGGTKTGIRRDRWRVEVNGSGSLSTNLIDSPITNNNGFTGLPTIVIGSFNDPSSRLGITITSNAGDSEVVDTELHVEIEIGKQA